MEDQEQPIWPEPQAERLVELLSVASGANLLIFAAVVVAGSLPVALLNPYWQLRVVALLTENGGFALMGFILIHLAAWLDPDHLQLSARCSRVRSLAVAVTIGYLLLIPLQPVAAWTSIARQDQLKAIERHRIEQQFDGWKTALIKAGDVEELRRRFKALNGPDIAEADRRRPWPSLRPQLLEGLSKARADALSAQAGPSNVELWEVAQVSLRRMTVALALALGFAAGAETPGAHGSLLQRWLGALRRQRISRAWRRQQRRQEAEQRRQLRLSLAAVEQSRKEQPLMVPAEPGDPDLLSSLQYSFDFTAAADPSMQPTAPQSDGEAVLQWAALEDPGLVLSIRWSSRDGCLLTFNRAVRLQGFTLAEGIASGTRSIIGFHHGTQPTVELNEPWLSAVGYELAEPLPLQPEEGLQLEGAVPVGWHHRDEPGAEMLPLAAITVLVQPPSLRMALKEEWQIWTRRFSLSRAPRPWRE